MTSEMLFCNVSAAFVLVRLSAIVSGAAGPSQRGRCKGQSGQCPEEALAASPRCKLLQRQLLVLSREVGALLSMNSEIVFGNSAWT